MLSWMTAVSFQVSERGLLHYANRRLLADDDDNDGDDDDDHSRKV